MNNLSLLLLTVVASYSLEQPKVDEVVDCANAGHNELCKNALPPDCHPSPATQANLDRVYRNGPFDPDMHASDFPQNRINDEKNAQTTLKPIPLSKVSDLQVKAQGYSIPIRVYKPSTERKLPTVLFIHGGGWVQGGIAGYDSLTRELANSLPAVVVSVGYRLAPEFPFPAAVEDTLAALKWAVKNLAELGGDPHKIMIVGDSAGGNLAAVLARKARKERIELALQVLIYPSTDLSDNEYPSYKKYGKGYFLTEKALRSLRSFYLTKRADWDSPDASPMLASDTELKSVAPAFVLLAGCDPLQDEGLAYARKLNRLGVPVRIQWEAGMAHGFIGAFNGTNIKLAEEVDPIFHKMLSQMREMLK